MPASICVHNLFLRDFSIFYVVNFELLRMPEMLVYFSVFIGYCDSHFLLSFRRKRIPGSCRLYGTPCTLHVVLSGPCLSPAAYLPAVAAS